MLGYCRLLLLASIPLFGIENHLFVGLGSGLGGSFNTHFQQEVSKNHNTCEDGICRGGQSSAYYLGNFGPSLKFIFGNEAAFDSLWISGLRIYGGAEVSQAALGSLDGKITKIKPKDQSFQTIIGYDSNQAPIFGQVTMLDPKAQQDFLLGNGITTTLSIHLDFFLNLPIDYFFQKKWSNFPFLKLGIFAGIGGAFELLKSPYWNNQSLYTKQQEAFYASGGGLFLNFGLQLYASKKDRLELGVQIPFYHLQSTSWNKINATNNQWEEQLLKQSFFIKKTKQIHLSYSFYF